MFLLIFIFFILGLVGLIVPKVSWMISNFWRYEGNAEPSKASLLLYRMQGILFLVVAIILYFVKY